MDVIEDTRLGSLNVSTAFICRGQMGITLPLEIINWRIGKERHWGTVLWLSATGMSGRVVTLQLDEQVAPLRGIELLRMLERSTRYPFNNVPLGAIFKHGGRLTIRVQDGLLEVYGPGGRDSRKVNGVVLEPTLGEFVRFSRPRPVIRVFPYKILPVG